MEDKTNSPLAEPEILDHILGYAMHHHAGPWTDKKAQIRHTWESMQWLSELRCVNSLWKKVIDDPVRKLWFHLAEALRLDPPKQLFSGGTYQKVCRVLLQHEIQAEQEIEEINAEWQNRGYSYRTGCMRIMPMPRGNHPHPERPPLQLPRNVGNQISETAHDLESFLQSINYSILAKKNRQNEVFLPGFWRRRIHQTNDQWHVTSLSRYQMFLYLKQKYPDIWIVPTAEIEFCWLAHIFRTKVYWEDMSRFNLDPKHSLKLSQGEKATFIEAVKATEALWCAEFGPGAEYLPPLFSVTDWSAAMRENNMRSQQRRHEAAVSCFQPDSYLPVMGHNSFCSAIDQLPKISLTPEEIQADLEWFPQLQLGLREISSNAYNVLNGGSSKKDLYRNHLIPSYERFLNLCFREGIENAAPPYVLDLVWHAHQVDPVAYKHDCLSLGGSELWHHPWPNGLGVSTQVAPALECAWKEAYGTTLEEDWQLRPTVGPPMALGLNLDGESDE